MDDLTFLLCGCVLAGCVLAMWLLAPKTEAQDFANPLPPGPEPSWLGSVELPRTYQWLTFTKWKETYGDLIYIRKFGNPILVLNSMEAANELLDKRSVIYSSRPYRTMASELMGWSFLFSDMPYGPRWREHRTLFHKYFPLNRTAQYHPVQTKETLTLLQNLSNTPDNFTTHIRRTGAAIAVSIAYGQVVAGQGDAYVALADKAMAGLGIAGVFGTYLVDYFPVLKHYPSFMPGGSFRVKAQEWRQLSRMMLEKPFEAVKAQMANGCAEPCLATWELEHCVQNEVAADEELIRGVCAITYAAGADTTVSGIISMFLAACIHPEFQRKAHQEIDRVVGSSRLPSFTDKEALPYVSCIAWECLRWIPVLPLLLAHTSTEDDVYMGYRIPKGTTVMPNVSAMFHDEKFYPDPYTFNPDRFADPETNTRKGINEVPWAAFGFGRRMCPGRWVGYDSLWMSIVSILAVYHISPALDEHGAQVMPLAEFTGTMLSRPKPFKCRIEARSEAAVALIKLTADAQA